MKRGKVLCGAFLLMTGCSTYSGSNQVPTQPGVGTVSRASASPIAANPAALACGLPVVSPPNPGEPPGGWVTFPGGQFARDPASLAGRLETDVPSYDRAIGGWVPVSIEKVASDGATYVVHNDPTVKGYGFYLVDARTGAQQLITSADGPATAPGSWQVADSASEGIYLWSVGILTVPGLWLLDPHSGNVRLVDGTHYWGMVAGGAAWALAKPFGAEAGAYNAVYRLDLASGQVTTWYETQGNVRMLSPTPDGGILIAQGDGYGQPELISTPKHLAPLEISPDHPQVTGAYFTHPGVWLALQGGGLALYLKGAAATVMSRSPDIFNVAGGCW
jgi:hypothetical protein